MDAQKLLSLSRVFFLRQPCYQLIDHFLLFIDENHKQNLCGKILTPRTHAIGILFIVTQHFIEEGAKIQNLTYQFWIVISHP